MNKQTEAQRLAAELDAYHTAPHHKEAAAELRRQEAVNAQLLEALEDLERTAGQPAMLNDPVRVKARAAIAAAKGEA
jgi:hypothetical protein